MGNRKGNWRSWPPERVAALIAHAEAYGVPSAATAFGMTVSAVRGHLFRSREHVNPLNIALDDEMHSRILAYRKDSRQRTMSAAVRDLLEWGLEAWEQEKGAEAP